MKNFGLVVLLFSPLMGCVSGQLAGEVGSEGGTSGIGTTGAGGSSSTIGDPGATPDAGLGGPNLGGTGGFGVPPTNVGAAGSRVVSGAGGSTGSVNPGMTLPCNVETMFKTNCQGCHSNPPVNGAPFSLVSYADILANGANAVVAMSNGSMPLGGPRATDAMIQTVQSWVAAGFPSGVACPPTGGGSGAGGSTGGVIVTPGVGGRIAGTGGAPAPGVGGRTGTGGAPGVGGSPAPGVGGAGEDNGGGDNGGGKGKG